MLFNNSSDGSYQIGGSVKRHNFNDSFLLTCHQTNSMASGKQIRDEIMRMTIVVNSNPAQQEIYKLTDANRKFAAESIELKKTREKVGKELGKNSEQYKVLTDMINSNTNTISANKIKIKELADTLDITQMSVRQLKEEAILLRRQLDRVVPGSEQYTALQTQLGAVNGRLAQVRGGAAATSSSFGSLASQFNHYSGIITAGVAMFVGFGLSIQAVIDRNNKLVDAQTAVGKTVNMTKEEVEDLTKTFSAFDTRTSKIDLLKIAETGGRLGVGKAQIKDFVQEVDKANVALGDGFAGGVEAVTDTLGKLKNLYGETKDLDMATAINQIGSAMNELGANGAATEANIGEFALRLGSLPAKLKPTIAEALALGAAFEESGIDAERAGTAYSTFVRNAATNADKFARVMGISKKEVEDLMNADPLEFFLKFSEGMKGMDTTQLANTMEYLKMNDQYVISSMGAASENTDKFRESIKLSNKSLTEATSLTNEFNKVNNNSAAIFEKVQKKLLGMFTSQAVADTLNYWISTFGKFIGAVEDSEGVISMFSKALLFIVKIVAISIVAIGSFNTAIALSTLLTSGLTEKTIFFNVIQKARTFYIAASTIVQSAYNLTLGMGASVLGLLTNNTKIQTFAQARLNAVTSANAIGAMVAVIIAGFAAYKIFIQSTDSAAESNKRLNESFKEAAQQVAKERTELDLLYYSATHATKAKNGQREAAEKLQKLYPEVFGNISTEIIMNGKAADSYNKLKLAILENAKIKAATSELEKRAAEDLENDLIRKQKMELALERYKKPKSQTINSVGGGGLAGGGQSNLYLSEDDSKTLAAKQYTALLKEQKFQEKERARRDKILLDIAGSSTGNKKSNAPENNKPDFEAPEGDKNQKEADSRAKSHDEKLKIAQSQYEKEMQDLAKKGEDAANLARQIEINIEDAKIEAMEEGFEKEMAALNLQEQRKIAEIDKKKHSNSDLDVLQKQIDEAKGIDKLKFSALKESWIKNNQELEKEKESQTAVYNLREGQLAQKFAREELKKEEENFKNSLDLLVRYKNENLVNLKSVEDQKIFLKDKISSEELSKITTHEEGKLAIEQYYLAESLKLQVERLKQKVAQFNAMVALNQLGALDPDQLKNIEDYKNQIAALLKQIDELGGNSKGKTSLKGLGGKPDVLGFTSDQWEAMFKNTTDLKENIGKITMAVQAVQAAFGAYYQYVQANEQAQMQQIDLNAKKKEKRLKKMLDSGQINQEQYEIEIQKLNEETERKKAKLEYEAAVRKRAMDVANVITNTALSIMNIMATAPFPVNFVMSGITGVMGALQLATILSTPLPPAPGYEDGFGMEYDMRRSQDGKKFRVKRKRLSSGEVHSPTHFIAGERGTEMVIDSPTYTRFRPEVKRILHNEISYAKGFEGGMYRNSNSSSSSNYDEKLMQIIEQNTMAMNAIRDKKFIAYLAKNMDNAKEIIEMTDEFNGYKKSSIKK